jgi:hypothetical protein
MSRSRRLQFRGTIDRGFPFPSRKRFVPVRRRGMLAAMRNYAWIALPTLLLALGCEEKAEKPTAAPAASSASQPEVKAPKRETVSDYDVKPLQDQFKCPNKANKEVCDVFEGFATGTKWDLTTIQSEQARYFGKAVVYKGGEAKERWVFLVVKKVPLNKITEGDLPLKIALRELDDSRTTEIGQAEKLLWLLKRDDAVTKRSQTANYVLDYTPSNWDSSAETKGNSIILHVGGGAFVRQGKARTLHLVKVDVARPGATSTDGMFANLYPISW